MKLNYILLLIILSGVLLIIPQTIQAASSQEEILHFSSASCQACVNQPELVKQIGQEHGIDVVLLQAEENQDLVNQYEISSVPALVLLKNDQVLGKLDGRISAEQLENFLAEKKSAVLPIDNKTNEISTDTTTSNDNILNDQKTSDVNIPLIVGVAAVVTAVGAGAVLLRRKKMSQNDSQPASDGLVASPADGSMVTQQQAKNEQSLIDQGFVYNKAKNGFDYIPKKEVIKKADDSILSKEIKKMRSKKKKGFLDDEIKKVHQERVDNIREDMNFDQKQYKKFIKRAETMDTLSKGAKIVGKTADVGVGVLSEMTGPAGKAIKKTYEAAKDAVTITDRTVAEGREGFLSASKEVLGNRVRGKVMDKLPIPKTKTGNAAIRYTENKVVGDYVDKELEEKIQKPLENKISKFFKKKHKT